MSLSIEKYIKKVLKLLQNTFSTGSIWLSIRWKVILIGLASMTVDISLCSAEIEQRVVGSIESDLLLNGRWLRSQKGVPRRTQTLSPLWSVRPALDFPLNHYLWVGGEVMVTWLSEPTRIEWSNNQPISEYKGGRRLALSPSLRGRVDFPLDCRWFIESLAVIGLTRWDQNEGSHLSAADHSRWGMSWRLNIGLRYAINTQVQMFMNVGYAEQVAYGDQDDIILTGYPISLGLRGGF